jgi:hypothetical protein
MLTQERLKELLHYDAETGIFTWLSGKMKGKRGGTFDTGRYRQIAIDKKLHTEHRLAWLYVYGEFPKNHIDHIDGCRANNSIANLRDVTKSVNMQNLKRARSDSKSGFLGVVQNGNKWVASIRTNGKLKHLGYFSTPEAASAAYISAKKIFHVDGYVHAVNDCATALGSLEG